MPAYKYTLKRGKVMWYANFYYTDWTGQKKHICKRGFKTQREAKEYERGFLDQQNITPDILFSSLVENYMEDMRHRLKPTTMKSKDFDILFYTGMRSGELLALTEPDILPDKKISVNKNYAVVDGEELFLEPKTPKANRTIAIPDFLYDDIRNYISMLGGLRDTDRIFYFTKSALDKEIKVGAAAAGLRAIRVHDLRHSHASMLVDMGFPPIEIAERLGHDGNIIFNITLTSRRHLHTSEPL